MFELKVTYYNRKRCVIDTENPYFSILRNQFSYDNPKARFTRYSRIPKRLYSITSKGYCDIGLLWRIKKFLKDDEWDVELKISDRVKSVLVNPIDVEISEVPNKKYQLRNYQKKSIENGFKLGNGICLIGTGGGKSLVISTMIETLYKKISNDIKVLLVVPYLSLIDQMYNDFKDHECSFTFSKWSGNNKLNENTNVVIVNTGFLQTSDNRSKDYSRFFDQIDYLFYDEVHLFGNEPEPKATLLLKEYTYKNVFGFTGTLKENTFESDRVYGFFGTPFYIKSSNELRNEKYLSNIKVKIININYNVNMDEVYNSQDDEKNNSNDEIKKYNNEIDFITNSEYRNNIVKKLVENLNGNVLILVDRIKQGDMLKDILKNIDNKRVFFIRGSMPVEERKKITDEMEKSDNIICIAMSKIFSTGISVNNIPYGMFYYIGKAWYKTIQSIGRGLRLHDKKNNFILFDICDNLIFSEKHSNQRKNIYENENIEYEEYNVNGSGN